MALSVASPEELQHGRLSIPAEVPMNPIGRRPFINVPYPRPAPRCRALSPSALSPAVRPALLAAVLAALLAGWPPDSSQAQTPPEITAAQQLQEVGDFAAAADALRPYLQRFPDDTGTRWLFGRLLHWAGNHAEARRGRHESCRMGYRGTR
ncbi:MAG: tetratricopeptide repeat protein [Gemmatimonadota bacterium]